LIRQPVKGADEGDRVARDIQRVLIGAHFLAATEEIRDWPRQEAIDAKDRHHHRKSGDIGHPV
jgi:hypothetical protein